MKLLKMTCLVLLLVLGGCGTIVGTEERGIAPYRGFTTDCRIICDDFSDGGFVMIYDLPLSFAVDTLMLPITIPFKGRYK